MVFEQMFDVKSDRFSSRSRSSGGAAVVSPEAGTGSRVARLREARGVMARASRGWGACGEGVGEPVRTWPVASSLRPVFPNGGLRRGSTVAVERSAGLLLALLAEASAQGAWCAVVGVPELGLVAAAEAGLRLSRLAMVSDPGRDLLAVPAMLLDGLNLVAVAGVERLAPRERHQLSGRARGGHAVLLSVGRWPGADLEISMGHGKWSGLEGGGAGRLRSRRVEMRVGGREAGHRTRSVPVLLPGPDGMVHDPREHDPARVRPGRVRSESGRA
jgi:hypothetical protein